MRHDEQGTLLVHLTVVCACLFVVVGLAFDGGSLLAARRRALDIADEAARAGAQAVSAPAADGVHLDTAAARRAACSYVGVAGAPCSATAKGDTVTVTITLRYRFAVLPLGPRLVTGTSSARAVRGLRRADP